MYLTRSEDLMARVTTLEALVAALLDELSTRDPTHDVARRIRAVAAETLAGRVAAVPPSDVSFTARAVGMLRSTTGGRPV